MLTTLAIAAAVTYTFGADSAVEYRMVHPLHKVVGTAHTLRGKATVTDGKLAVPLTLKLFVVGFDSGNASRDTNALLSLQADRFPAAVLTVASFVERSRTPAGDVAGDATGTLTLHGVTKPVTIPLTAHVAADRLTVDAAFDVSLTAHEIPRPSLLTQPVEDAVHVTVHGVAKP